MKYHITIEMRADEMMPQSYLQDVMKAVNSITAGRFVQRAYMTSNVKCRDCAEMLSTDDWAFFVTTLMWSVNTEGDALCQKCLQVCHEEGDDLDDLSAEFCG